MTTRPNSRVIIALCMMAWLVMTAQAQSGRLRKPAEKEPIRLVVNEVSLTVGVRYHLGKLRPHLSTSDLFVIENNKRCQVMSVTRAPANILLIIDTGGKASLHKRLDINLKVAERIIDSLSGGDRAAIITYANGVKLVSSWTGDKQALREALRPGLTVGIKSDFCQSILYAADNLLPKVNGRRSVVMLTDGRDTDEPYGYKKLLPALHRARATVYIANYNEAHSFARKKSLEEYIRLCNKWYMMLIPRFCEGYGQAVAEYRSLVSYDEVNDIRIRELAEQTGGVRWTLASWDDFNAVADEIIWEIGNEYRITYISPPDYDDGYHPIKVAPTRTDIMIRAPQRIRPAQASK